jgi:hypothetical protein
MRISTVIKAAGYSDATTVFANVFNSSTTPRSTFPAVA